MNKKWEYYDVDFKETERIKENYGLDDLIATVLVNRNIKKDEDIRKFLYPSRNDFYDPFLLPDMKKAVNRIKSAIENKEDIIIYGDYDVDGITSIAVLKKFLEQRGLKVKEYIPNRLEEGYGLNHDAIKEIHELGYKLMITVDCGISGIDEIEYANSLGIETIVTDHHEPLEELPNAISVIDPKIKTSSYPFSQLAGVGVVFKLIQAIGTELGLDEKEYLKYLDLVCIGTISDIVPLIDENRVITKLGLKLIEVTKNIGLKTLLESVGYAKIDSTSISFGIAPRINACGRMGHANEALELFLTNDLEEAKKLTNNLNLYNKNRQEIEKKIFEEAIQIIKENNLDKKDCIVIGGDNWHHGVIGIVASKITDLYYKPSILICFSEEDGKGSGRSIPGFDLHKALCNSSQYLEKYGGHEMAIGLSLKKSNFELFKKSFENEVKNAEVKEITPVLYIDKNVTEKNLNVQSIEQLKLLEPFGEGNKCPLFSYKHLKIDSIRALTEGRHLKLTLKEENKNTLINAIGFNMGNLAEQYRIGDKIDIVGTLEINSFNGKDIIQFNLKDIMKSI